MSALSQNPDSSHDELVALRVDRPTYPKTFLRSDERQSALALARAIMPEAGGLPEAGSATVLRAENWLADVPMAGDGYRALLRGFDLYVRAATGKYLQSVDPERLRELCRRFAEGDIGRRYFLYTLTAPLKGAYFDDPAIYRHLAFHIAARRQRYRRHLCQKNCRAGRMSGLSLRAKSPMVM